MVIIRNKEIKNLNDKELEDKIKDLRLEILKISSQKATQSAAGTKKVKEIKKTIARMKTQINIKKTKTTTK